MATALTQIPDSIPAKTTVKYSRAYSDYPSTGGAWTLTLYLVGASVLGANGVGAAGVADGSGGFDFTLTPTQTDLVPGAYRWEERATNLAGTETYVAASGWITVDPCAAGAAEGAQQADAEKMLTLIRAALTDQLSSDMAEFQIAGRSVRSHTLAELKQLEAHYESVLWRLKNPGQSSPSVRVAFTGVGQERWR